MHSNKGHDQVGPVANGTATRYATGDAMFKASATAQADLPRRAPGPPHAKRAGSAIAGPSWRVANEDEAAEVATDMDQPARRLERALRNEGKQHSA